MQIVPHLQRGAAGWSVPHAAKVARGAPLGVRLPASAQRRLSSGASPAGRVAERLLLPRAKSLGDALDIPGLVHGSTPPEADAVGAPYLQLDNTFYGMTEGQSSRSALLDKVFQRYCGGPALRKVQGELVPFRFTYRNNQLWRAALPLPASPLSAHRGLRPGAIATCAPGVEGFRPEDYFWMLMEHKATDVLTLVDSPWWPRAQARHGDIDVTRLDSRTTVLPALRQSELAALVQLENKDLWLATLRRPEACTTDATVYTSVFLLKHGGASQRVTVHLFIDWPDLGVIHGRTLAGLVRTVQNSAGHGPLVVNCLAGVGRTGTYLCADALTRHAPRLLDKQGYGLTLWEIFKLRLQRPKMVQREVQFFGALAALPYLTRTHDQHAF